MAKRRGDAPLPLSFSRWRQWDTLALLPAPRDATVWRRPGTAVLSRPSPRLAGDWEVRRRSPRFSRGATVARETRTACSPSRPCPASLLATRRLALVATLARRHAARPRSGVGARSPGPSGGSSPLGSRACARPSTRRPPGLACLRLQTDPRLAACLAAGARGRRHRGRPAGSEDGASAEGKAGSGDVASGTDCRASMTPTRTWMRAREPL